MLSALCCVIKNDELVEIAKRLRDGSSVFVLSQLREDLVVASVEDKRLLDDLLLQEIDTFIDFELA